MPRRLARPGLLFSRPPLLSGEGDLLEPEAEELDRELELELDRELEPDCWLSEPDSLDLLFLARCFFPQLMAPEVAAAETAELGRPALPGARRAGSCLSWPGPAGYWDCSARPARESFQP